MLDTNVLLDWLLRRDERRFTLVTKLLGGDAQLQVPDMVVAELAFALEKFYKLPRDLVVLNLQKVIEEPIINCNRALFRQVLPEYASQSNLSFIDVCLLGYARLNRAGVVYTFDQDLVKKSAGRAKLLG